MYIQPRVSCERCHSWCEACSGCCGDSALRSFCVVHMDRPIPAARKFALLVSAWDDGVADWNPIVASAGRIRLKSFHNKKDKAGRYNYIFLE